MTGQSNEQDTFERSAALESQARWCKPGSQQRRKHRLRARSELRRVRPLTRTSKGWPATVGRDWVEPRAPLAPVTGEEAHFRFPVGALSP